MHALQGKGSSGKFNELCLSCTTATNTLFQAKPTHQNIIRLAPPLVITDEQVESALQIIKEAIEELPTLKGKKEEEVIPDPSEKNVHIGVDN